MIRPFTFILLGVALIACLYAVRAVMGYRAVRADAQTDYMYKSSQGMIPVGTRKPDYLQAYHRTYAPRGAAYVASALAAVCLLTAPASLVIQFVLEQIWVLTGRGDVIHPGYLVWQFLIFFSILGLWASIIYLTARRFHRKAPLSFDAELERVSNAQP